MEFKKNEALVRFQKNVKLEYVRVISNNNTAFKPSLQVYKSTSINVAELPTYANFVTETSAYYFLEMVHTIWGYVNVNLLSIERLELIDSSNTKVYFNATDYVELWWGPVSTKKSIKTYAASGSYPSTASLIATMTFVSNIK